MSEYGVSQRLPRAPFSIAELTGMVLVIGSQVAISGSLPDTPEVRRRIRILTHIGEVLQQQLEIGRSVALPLDAEEMTELLGALRDFSAHARARFEPDPQRDEVICTIENWGLRLSSIVAEHHMGVR